jgi:hypothetical protein
MGRYLISFLLVVSLISCAPAKFVPKKEIELKFDPTPPYELDLSKIPKPEPIKPIFVDEDFKETEIANAKFVVLVPEEYAKVAALLKLAKAYKEIALEQGTLVNIYINNINSMKELVVLEQVKIEHYRSLWVDSENMFRQELYDHKVDNTINRGALGIITIGAIIALIAL